MKRIAVMMLAAVALSGCNLLDPPYQVFLTYGQDGDTSAPLPHVNVFVNDTLRTSLTPELTSTTGRSGVANVRVAAGDRVCVIVGGSTQGFRYTVNARRAGLGSLGFTLVMDGTQIKSFEPSNDNTGETTRTTSCP